MKAGSIPSASIAAVFAWVVASSAAWLAAADQPWVLTQLLFAVGVGCILCPPSTRLPVSVELCWGLLLGLVVAAFLPANWNSSGFQKPFLEHGFVLPWTTSPQPWLTFEDFTLLVATVLWAWTCFETKLSVGQREFLIACFLGVLGLIALNTILRGTVLGQGLPQFFQGSGQFQNRNQTGDILVMGGILAFARGFAALSGRKLSGLAYMALTCVFIVAIIRNGSRAAVLLIALGLLLFLVLASRKRRINQAGLAMLVVVVIAGALIFFLEGADLRVRFLALALGHEGRIPLYQDAAAMIPGNPWSGVGLGNFEGVFNTTRNYSLTVVGRALHPDSDWWWLALELGPGGVLLIALLVWLTFRIYLSKTPFPVLTPASQTIAIVFLIHSLVDVGGHRLGAIWTCLYLVSLGACRTDGLADRKAPLWLMIVVGLVVCLVAALRVQAMSLQPWMPIRGSLLTITKNLMPSRPLAEQTELLNRGIVWAPLDWTLYYRRGLVSLQERDLPHAEADFSRVLFLDQSTTAVPFSIGEASRQVDWVQAMLAWKELLRRAGPEREDFYENLCTYPIQDVGGRLAVASLAEDDPNLEVIAIVHQEPPEFKWLRDNFLASNPTLDGVSPVLSRRFFDRWAQMDDAGEFVNQWPQHPEWKTPGWRAYARALAGAGRYQDAVTAALHAMPPPPMPDFPTQPNLDEATREYQARPQDPYAGVLLYFAQKSSGDDQSADATLKTLATLPAPPAYIQYLFIKSMAASGQYEPAWRSLNPMLDQP